MHLTAGLYLGGGRERHFFPLRNEVWPQCPFISCMVRSGAYRCHMSMLTDCWGRSLTSFPQLIRGHSSKWCLSKVPRCRVELWGHWWRSKSQCSFSTGRFCCEWDPDNDNVLRSTKSSLGADPAPDPTSEQSPECQHTPHANYFLPSALQRPQILQPHPSNRTSLLCGRQRSNCRNNTVSLPVNFLFFNNDKWFSCEEHDCSSEQFSSGQFVTGQLDKISTTQ